MVERSRFVRWAKAISPSAMVDCTVAIVGGKRPVSRQYGTGTLVSLAGWCFVVTAGHVLDEIAREGYTAGMSGSGDRRFIALSGRWICSGSHGDREPLDVAVYKLDDRQLARLGDRPYVGISAMEAKADGDYRTAYFSFCGFPRMWATETDSTTDTMELKPLQFAGRSYDGDAPIFRFSPEVHLLINAKDDEQLLLDDSGREYRLRTRGGHAARFPSDIQGASGSGVWKVGDLGHPPDHWKAADARLVGVLTSVYERAGLIKVTKWSYVLALMREAFPELRTVL